MPTMKPSPSNIESTKTIPKFQSSNVKAKQIGLLIRPVHSTKPY